ncbi:MAG: hypothetical protein ACHP7O_05650 [Burkholderiales bacterium]
MNDLHFSDRTWREIARWAEERLTVERRRNDDAKLDAAQTAFCRGRISILKDLLALPAHREAQARMDEPQ